MRRKDREVTLHQEIENIICQCRLCHLAMVDNGLPYVVPLNFGYFLSEEMLTLYFHSAKTGRKIDVLRRNPQVCFEMTDAGELGEFENPCNAGYYYQSVIGNGKAEFIDDVFEKCRALTLLMKHQSGRDISFTPEQAETVLVFKVVSTDFTGKKKPAPGRPGRQQGEE